jgi:hypothetical protein
MSTGRAPTQAVSIPYCAERRRLLEEFTQAVQDLGFLHSQQVAQLLEGDEEFTRFDILLHLAAERKKLAKYAYMSHVEAHGCGASKESQAA